MLENCGLVGFTHLLMTMVNSPVSMKMILFSINPQNRITNKSLESQKCLPGIQISNLYLFSNTHLQYSFPGSKKKPLDHKLRSAKNTGCIPKSNQINQHHLFSIKRPTEKPG